MTQTPILKATGTVQKVRFRAESGFAIIMADLDLAEGSDSGAIVVGVLPPLDVGDRFEAQLSYQEHPEYGHQYRALQLWLTGVDSQELSEEGIRSYLQTQVRGIGPKLAARIVETFGLKTFEIIEQEPSRLLQVRGMSESVLHGIVQSWDSKHGDKRLFAGLQALGLSVQQTSKAIAHFGPEALDILKKDLYALTEIEGIGYITADKLARASGIEFNDPRRLSAAAVYALQQAQLSAGHAFLPVGRMIKGIAYYTGVSAEQAEAALELARLANRVMIEDNAVYLPYVWRAESELAVCIAELLQHPPEKAWRIPKAVHEGLNAEQSKVLKLLAKNSIVLLSGGPGTGKSFTTKAVLDIAARLGLEVGMCAPTGKAARRLEEVTGARASTIHRLLGYGPIGFHFGVLEPLPLDVIVVDEVSMCGDMLLLSLLRAIDEGTRVLLVGDIDQLPPVDYGMPLQTLMSCVPNVHLQKIYRQAEHSPIVRAAHRLRQGLIPEFDAELRFVGIEADTGALEVARLVRELGGPSEIQVLSPMRKGPLGVEVLNQMLQAEFNPGTEGVKVGDDLIRVGDIVVQTKNDYQNEVFNGTLGRVIDQQGNTLQIDFEGNVVKLSGADIWNIQLGYALTVHRAQGSEWSKVLTILHDTQAPMLSRELAYTALTRAKDQFIGVGSLNAWRNAALRHREPRLSKLTERLQLRLQLRLK